MTALPSPTSSVSDVFGAFSDPTRRRLFERLAGGGPATASSLALQETVSRQAIVKHLQVLADAGLVEPQRVGREVRYSVVDGGWTPASAWLRRHEAAWAQRLQRLERALGAKAAERTA